MPTICEVYPVEECFPLLEAECVRIELEESVPYLQAWNETYFFTCHEEASTSEK